MLEGATALLTLTVHVQATAPDGTSLTNAASVSSTTSDPVPGNGSATVTVNVAARADLAIIKSGPASPVAGADATYSIVATNNGPSDAKSVTMTDAIPAGVTFRSFSPAVGWSCTTPAVGSAGPANVTCSLATLATGSTATFGITVRPTAATPDGASLCNSATIATTTQDRTSSNNSSQSCGTVRTQSDLRLTATSVTTGKAGKGTATFTFVIGNLGPSDSANLSFVATSSLFSSPAPGAITTTGSATCTVGGQNVSCTSALVSMGSSIQIVVSVPWKSSVGQICATGSVTAGTPDPIASNNAVTACIGKK